MSTRYSMAFVFSLLFATTVFAQQPAKKKAQRPFQWVNALPAEVSKALHHETFHSSANGVDVGYCILLPPSYNKPGSEQRRYPVIYWLHGGRPGSETKNISMSSIYEDAMKDGTLPELIVVFPNGGKLSHYDHEGFLGETAFRELVDHVDSEYRTVADRSGRAIEGFSQGGRGTARYLFKYPELFCSAAPLGGGQQHEKRISENSGKESEALTIQPATNNTWDLAEAYAKRSSGPEVKIFVAVGEEDDNAQGNREWSQHLNDLGIDHTFVVVPGVPHSSKKMYAKIGRDILNFHAKNFRANGSLQQDSN
ncbi:Endo-1,4-beta-xylanase/feruloyl esterase precursor [Thalassoglobus neptunius]|uniref:Endo-1,4-beta-xylanase/feruloyl esterase n=1 Tax=Thalassoglobus neptunius TaxID=1938619 RepID=A0A5C5WMW7_9PLAN|nr:alpha/beta hydrolase-fold protein [Thalassoglobus neptunius]TWT51967.1 Endo-1,4-beta-xylanase/feruloyl esterase precursor [Thalassoglobus neptunius]